jgi:MFS family permease
MEPDAPALSKKTEVTGPRGWYTVFVLALVAMLGQIDRGAISLMVQPMKRDLDLSDTQVSLLIGFAFTFFYAIFGPPISRIADRGMRRGVIASSLAIWSVGTSLCGLAQNFWGFFAARGVVGAAESGSSPASLSMIANVIPRNRLPRAFAIYNAGVMGGMALSLVVGGVLLGMFSHIEPFHVAGIGIIRDWQIVFMLLGIPGLLVATLVMMTVPEPQIKAGHKPKGYPIREVFAFIWANRAMHIPLLLGVLIMSMQTFGINAWGPAFYERTYGWGPEIAGPWLGGVSLGTTLVGLVIGAKFAEWMGERYDSANLRVLFVAQITSIPFVAAAPLMPTPELALLLTGTGGILAGMGGPAYNAALQLSTPNQMRGQINALYLFTIAAVGGGLGPLIVALLTDFVAQSEDLLRYVLVGFRLVLGPIDAILIFIAIRHYGKAFRQRIDEGE